MSGKYIKRKKPLRGGWDVEADEYKSLGFTIGLPPNLFIPKKKEIEEISHRFETSDLGFVGIDSKFSVQERQILFQAGHIVRCYVGAIPPGIEEIKLKNFINQTLYKKHLTSNLEVVSKVSIHPQGLFAFVDFEKHKDAERFVELKDSLVMDGYTLRIKRSNMASYGESGPGIIPQEKHNSLIISNIPHLTNEKEIYNLIQDYKELISQYALVDKIQIPELNGVSLGYMLIDLVNTNLSDYICFKLKYFHNIDCRRCFPRLDQKPREEINIDKIEELKFYYKPERNHYSILNINDLNDLTIADILNLDVNISKIVTEIPNFKGNILKIFNVTKSNNQKELEIVLNDMIEECSYFGKIIKSEIDFIWDCLVNQLYPPIIITFDNSDSARRAQLGISGRKYCGNIVITQIE